MGTLIVGFIIFGLIAGILARLIINARRGRLSCGCGNCAGCGKNTAPLKNDTYP